TTMTETSAQKTVQPSEVGWQFVPQYYTFVNKQPNRLHCFYTKASTFIHGTEGEDGKPCFGQQEIHNKITSIGFEDCKVFIHSVDAQSSANGGIIIQVIGEMSNRGEPWRKFVQTFFLAEQPNGYFVLNDIFRFLKEETVEEESEAASEPEAAVEPDMSVPQTAVAPVVTAPAEELELTPEPVAAEPEAEQPAVEELATPAADETADAQGNGHAQPEAVPELEPEPALAPEKPVTPAPIPTAEPSKPPTPAPPPAAASPAPSVPAPVPPVESSPAPAVVPVVQSAPVQPAAPPQPKTWANLAATNSKKWGSAVAQESRGTSEVPAASSSSPASGAQTPTHSGPRPGTRTLSEQSPAMQAALATPTPQCFVKSVQESVSDLALRHVLNTRFGPIKELEIVRSKACAFLEFQSLDAARRAIAASLPVRDGGDGGIRIDGVDGSQGVIRVEVRKERGERP
ncbi:hypothetical protein K488DRAFT_38894, partial [Vararia minispora EC-137]